MFPFLFVITIVSSIKNKSVAFLMSGGVSLLSCSLFCLCKKISKSSIVFVLLTSFMPRIECVAFVLVNV